jgi:hypothetical protein
MPKPLRATIPRHVDLESGYAVRIVAIDPTTGAAVAGVSVADVTLQVRPTATSASVPGVVVLPPPPVVTSGAVTVTYTVSGTNITLTWPAVSGAVGYEFLLDGTRVSNTWDGSRTSVTFAIPQDDVAHTYTVIALKVADEGSVTYQVGAPPPPPPPPPPTGAAPIWNGDFTADPFFAPGMVEYGGTFDGTPALSQRVTIASSIDGITPPRGLSKLAKITVAPGDQYGGSTGWRTLSRQYNPLRTFPQGHDSWFVYAVRVPDDYPGDATPWVAPWEVHQTKASYVTVTGVAPAHMIAKGGSTANIDVAGGRDGARVLAVNHPVPFTHGEWNIYAMRYKHDLAPNGAFELYRNGSPLIQRTGIGTMYEGTQNYFEWGLYRAQSGTSVTTMYLAGVREYANKSDALAYAASLA